METFVDPSESDGGGGSGEGATGSEAPAGGDSMPDIPGIDPGIFYDPNMDPDRMQPFDPTPSPGEILPGGDIVPGLDLSDPGSGQDVRPADATDSERIDQLF